MTPRVTHIHKERDDAYRAIGRYVVKFSELIRKMRKIIASVYVAKDSADRRMVDLLMGEATAQPIANVFFELCHTMGELDENEESVWRALSGRSTKPSRCGTRSLTATGRSQKRHTACLLGSYA